TIAYERAQVLALLRQARADLAQLDAAAQRLDEGGGTRCASCGAPIGLERLLALPATSTCVACAR
ncbi:MAG TPA: TraR/DksA C4-type zinc finger protein, partial [Acidimicrobiales bacterium]